MVWERERSMETNHLLSALGSVQDLAVLEELADVAATNQDSRLVEPLIGRLTEERVRADDDTFAAVCDALTALGVMEQLGNLNYKFRSTDLMPAEAVAALKQSAPHLPSTLFPEGSTSASYM